MSASVNPPTTSSKSNVKVMTPVALPEATLSVIVTVGGVLSSLPEGAEVLPPPPQAAIKADAAKAAQVGLNNLKWCFMIVSLWWVRNRKRFQLRG
jgi:hypothetical protein